MTRRLLLNTLRMALAVSAVLGTNWNRTASAQTSAVAFNGTQPPDSWIDKDTGHRIFRLTSQAGSRSLYFNLNAFTYDDSEMAYFANGNIYLVNLSTHQSRILIAGPVSSIVVSRTAPVIYFMKAKDQRVYAADTTSGELTQIGILPVPGNISSINADNTLLAGTYIDGTGQDFRSIPIPTGVRPSDAARMTLRVESKVPMVLFTMNLANGAVTPILRSTDWLNHLQFSPKDPSLLMYCHEGLWQDVDRIWTIRTDGSQNHLIHKRTSRMEVAGHEFWDSDWQNDLV